MYPESLIFGGNAVGLSLRVGHCSMLGSCFVVFKDDTYDAALLITLTGPF